MKRILFLTTVVLALACYGRSQDCNGIINDEAGIIKDQAAVARAVQPLINEGADVKVLAIQSIAKYGSGLYDAEKYYESKCQSWKAGHARKANLFVIMVAPTDHKKNVFYGEAYEGALPPVRHRNAPDSCDVCDVIYSRASSALFHQGLWAEGIAAAAKDFSARIVAYHDQQQHPATSTTSTTNNYDFSFLKTFAWLLFAALGLFFGGWLVYSIVQRRKRMADELAEAQTTAIAWFNRANTAYLNMPQDNPQYGAISQRFTSMSNSIKGNPNESLNGKAEYVAVGQAWRDLLGDIDAATKPKRDPQPHFVSDEPASAQKSKHDSRQPKPKHAQKATPYPRSEMPPTPAPPTQQTTVIREGGGSDFLTGVVVGDMLGSRREPEPEPERHYRDPEPEPEPTRSSSWDSGSDSSWGSSDSSSSDSGSDSSFGGGSDSGGGGGSDSSF